MEGVEKMARNVYPHLLEWLGKAEVKGYFEKVGGEEIEKVRIIPDEEFNSGVLALTITKTLLLFKDRRYEDIPPLTKRIYEKYGVGIYISDKHPYLKRAIIHELIHLAGYYWHYITFNGYIYDNSGVIDGVESYLVMKFKDVF